MGREGTPKPNYEILAFITTDKERVISGKALSLYARNPNDAEEMMKDIAKAMKADVVKMKSGDYLVIRI